MKTCLALLFTVLIISGSAFAGSACRNYPLAAEDLRNALRMASLLHNKLELHDPDIAFVSRVGSDLSRFNLTYSHAGMLVKQKPQQWLLVHELNKCETATSEIFNEGLINFFIDTSLKYQAKLVIPSEDLQHNLMLRVSNNDTRLLHEAKYSMLANPEAVRYQNSNQWLLELVAMAQQNEIKKATRVNAQSWLKRNGFRADIIPISAGERLGAVMFRDNVKFNDHSFASRLSGMYPVVTVKSFFRYLEQTDEIIEESEFLLEAKPVGRLPQSPNKTHSDDR